MSDHFEDVINKMEVKCPIHNLNMIGQRYEIKTGYTGLVRKIMYIGRCAEDKCGKWFELLPPDTILWP